MNIKEIIKKIADDPRLGGFVKRDGYDGCAYRTADGFSCAIGCLVSDETLRAFPDKNDKTRYDATTNNVLATVVTILRVYPDYDFLANTGLTANQAIMLQNFHDSYAVTAFSEIECRKAVKKAFKELLETGEATYDGNYYKITLKELEENG
jgi:hypothetical protein